MRSFIPAFAEAEVVLHRKEFPPQPDDEAYRIFAERVSRTNYDRHWKHTYTGPGFKSHLLAIFVFLVPKIGGASDLAIKIPNAETQEWYLRSVNHTVDVFDDTLHKELAAVDPAVGLANIDLDTGKPAQLGGYSLADQAYAQWLAKVTAKPGKPIPRELKQHLLDFYAQSATNSPLPESIIEQLATLKNIPIDGRH